MTGQMCIYFPLKCSACTSLNTEESYSNIDFCSHRVYLLFKTTKKPQMITFLLHDGLTFAIISNWRISDTRNSFSLSDRKADKLASVPFSAEVKENR